MNDEGWIWVDHNSESLNGVLFCKSATHSSYARSILKSVGDMLNIYRSIFEVRGDTLNIYSPSITKILKAHTYDKLFL